MTNNEINLLYMYILESMLEIKYQSWFEYFIKFI
jgi:hypothetical protein